MPRTLPGLHNRLLRALPPDAFDQLRPLLEPVALKPRRVLHHWNMPMEHVYFVESGLVSVVARLDPETAVEVWLVGCEGMTGIPVVLGGDDAPPHRRVVQVAGQALRISAADLRAAMQTLPSLRDILLRYVQVVLLQTSQAGACNSSHTIQQRLARWLLTAQDRLDESEIPLTHEVLARLLGVRRPSVTEAMLAFESAGAVEKARGRIRICDRGRLEALSCSCHRAIRAEYERLVRAASASGDLALDPTLERAS